MASKALWQNGFESKRYGVEMKDMEIAHFKTECFLKLQIITSQKI